MAETRDLQFKILDIYKAVRIILEKYNLTYFAIGGTAIGAVRHEGFIPWDGDMDIAMPREDYNKLLEVLEQELPEKYEFRKPSKSLHHNCKFTKVIDKTTTVIEGHTQFYKDCDGGVFLDIFPVDGISDNKALRFLDLAIQNIVSIGDLIFSFDVLFLGTLLKPFGIQKLCRYIHYKNAAKYSVYKTKEFTFKWIYPLNSRLSLKSSWVKEIIDIKFEDTTVKIFKDYDDYLKTNFGNYMKMPPQILQHDNHMPIYINLNMPYSTYRLNKKNKTL